MRFFALLALPAAVVMSANAWAQDTTTPPPAPVVPPSTCAAVTQAPAAPDGATATTAQMQAGAAAFETWRASEQTTINCRRAEAEGLRLQAAARADEYRAAQADNQARATAFQAQIAIFEARPERSRR